MVARKQTSVNLGIPVTPQITKDMEMYQELLRVYNALRNLTYNYDDVLGLVPPDPSTITELGSTTVRINGLAKIYKTAAATINYGQTVGLDSLGKAILGTDGKVIGFCSAVDGALIGDTCEITVLGKFPPLPASTLVPGTKYFQSGTAGSIGPTGVGTQCIGFAMSDTDLFFLPQL